MLKVNDNLDDSQGDDDNDSIKEGVFTWVPPPPEEKKLSVDSKEAVMAAPVDVSIEIQKIFDENKVADLKKFMNKRHRLNIANTFFMYGFHIFQAAGILTTTIATGYQFQGLIWVGVGLNVMSSILMAFEKINTSVSTKLMKDISAIRDGTYVDEGTLINDVSKKDSNSNANSVD